MAKKEVEKFSNLMSDRDLKLLTANGKALVQEIGLEVVRGVVLDVLCGRNLRDSTESLTRRRIAALNLATLNLFVNGAAQYDKFVENLPAIATRILQEKRVNKAERWLAQWIIGLTDKAFQNVLRDRQRALSSYRDKYIEACSEVIKNQQVEFGSLTGELQVGSDIKARINWLFMLYLMNTIGSQTLAIRGSEKSAYGKLLEKFVLGSLLHILGFHHVAFPPNQFQKVFWLSSRDERRESDATLLYEAGKGVRFDIGFIGRGNPEISLDKVSRFERELSIGRSKWYLATIILVDRIGENSRIERLAKEIKGTIIQMSSNYWPQQVAKVLKKTIGLNHPLIKLKQNLIGEYLKESISKVPLLDFIANDTLNSNPEESD